MRRREFLELVGLGLLAPGLRAGLPETTRLAIPKDRYLVLVELHGGNDGLNTLIPFRDPLYRQLRPNLAIAPDRVLSLSPSLGFHPALEPLLESFTQGDLGVVAGLGYPDPNRSHFRSIEIWETASDAHDYLDEGWIARAFAASELPPERVADSIVLGRDEGPMAGPERKNVVMRDPQGLLKGALRMKDLPERHTNPALAHILGVRSFLREAAQRIEARIQAVPTLPVSFPNHALGRQLEGVAKAIAAGLPVPVFKTSLAGFDTHARQIGAHERLLSQLGAALAAFRSCMRAQGHWDRVLVMTYSEFGRRAAENGSLGTDHGTAAPHLVTGGKVKGGLHGVQPSLARLVDGDLVHTVDFRSLYATVVRGWWGLPPASVGLGGFPELPLLG